MILGIGTDICGVDRLKKTKDSFRKRCYTQQELEYAGGKPERLAGMFAAKEALVKALGTGFQVADLHAVEVFHNENGAPYYRLSGWAKDSAEKLGVRHAFLSISHDNGNAIAFCVLES